MKFGRTGIGRGVKKNIGITIMMYTFILIAVIAYISNRTKINEMKEEIKDLEIAENNQRIKNEDLINQVASEIDDELIEKIAREQLGLRKSVETIFYNDIND